MDAYLPLLEKTRVPQPSLQKLSVISIFSKLRSAPNRLGPESEPGREAISFCLTSNSPAVVDQSVRELCCLVSDSVLDVSRGLLELQSALDASDPQFVPLFVKGLGFLVRIGYERKRGKWSFSSTDSHPFVRILLCRAEVQTELLHQVLLFMMHNKPLGVVEVCEFLKPFLNFSILRLPFTESGSSLFLRELVSSMSSLCCTFGCEAIPVFRLLMSCLKYASYRNSDEVRNLNYFLESLVDAHTVVLRDLAGTGLPVTKFQLLGVELVETVLSLCASPCVRHKVGKEPVVEQLKHLLAVQKDLGLQYVPELSSSILSLFVILVKSDLEHEQLSTLKFLQFLLNWKSENENTAGGVSSYPSEELLLVFPTINLMSSPSKSVKGVAIELISLLEKLLLNLCAPKVELVTETKTSISEPGPIVFRLMQQLWFQDHLSSSSAVVSYLAFTGVNEFEILQPGPKIWPCLLKEYSKSVSNSRRSSTSASQSQEVPLLLGAVAGLLVMHPSFINDGIDSLAAVGFMDPNMGVPVLLAVLFYINMLTKKDATFQIALPKLLGVLPPLASQSMMIPLIVQTIMPMLRKDVKPGVRATAIRLLCQTWEVNDRAFSSLQGVLLPKAFINHNSERHIGICIAASIRDVCRKNPDRGVDLILSVQACIESDDCTIRALGVQSLSHLCEADVIDFYTAWNVINKNLQNLYGDPILLQSLCLLLRWGALDAAAYPEDSVNVLKILWEIASLKEFGHGSLWTKARVYALQSLAQYEVSYIEKGIPELKKDAAALLFSETNAETLKALEDLQIKIMIHEHSFRRRHVKDKRLTRSKIEKLVYVIPQSIFPSGEGRTAGEVPGAALLCLSFKTRNMNYGASKGYRDLNAQYADAFREVAVSLQLSRNIIVALISLQSMKSYMRRWMRANILPGDSSVREIVSDKTTKASNDILKSLRQMAEESIPRSAENIALGLGALCTDLPSSAHTIRAAASNFLLEWLFQHEHEHRQWTAALSLGVITSSLHVTDHKQKFQNISGLLEVLSCSKSTLVKGACAIGLGFSSQSLLTRTEAGTDTSNSDKQNNRNLEESLLLGRIVRLLSSTLCQVYVASSDILETLSSQFPAGIEDNTTDIFQLSHEHIGEEFDDDVWGIAGLVIGLGLCVGAVYRTGKKDTVVMIKELITSWISHADSLIPNTSFDGESSRIVMSVGSCLALPIVVGFCQKVELFDGSEVDYLINSYRELISEIFSFKKSGTIYKSLLMASCIGAGNLLAFLLNVGIHPVNVESVKSLLELFRECYSRPYPPIVHFGGMLGVINAMGAGAGNLEYAHPLPLSSYVGSEKKGNSYVSGSLLSSPFFSQLLTPIVQEIFLIAQDSKDQSMQEYAAWAISVLGNYVRSREQPSLNDDIQADTARPKPVSHNISEDTMVMKLALWLNNLNFSETGSSLNIDTVATVLRCLASAPRLPTLDWGAIIRRCMKHAASFTTSLLSATSSNQGTLREDCLRLSFAHASQFDVLISFLDELSDLSRFTTLELNLQSCLLSHLADLMRLFSGSRIEKLLDDIPQFIVSLPSQQEYSSDQKSELRMSCWKGISQCLDETSLESLEFITKIEKCMELLFTTLPALQYDSVILELNAASLAKEWSEAVTCLGRSRGDWLHEFLQVSHLHPLNRNAQFSGDLKKIQARAKLTRVGNIPFTELGRIKSIILNCKSHEIWGVLIEVVAALQKADAGVRRQWLINAGEISCISSYPSTALLFVGLLSGSCCNYIPLLLVDQSNVLKDLPFTLTSLLSDPSWEVVAETFISYLWSSMQRIHEFVASELVPGMEDSSGTQPIDASERDKAPFLLKLLHQICVSFKELLPLDKQLRLASMAIIS